MLLPSPIKLITTSHRFWYRLSMLVSAACLAFVVGCPEDTGTANCSENPEDCVTSDDAVPARLYVDPPFGLGFGCVLIGCNDAKTLTLENRGGGKLAITSVRFQEGSSPDFSFKLFHKEDEPEDEALPAPSVEAPLLIKDSKTKALEVTYIPTDGIADEAVLVIEAHDASLPYKDSVLTTLEVPLRSRVLGSVVLTPSASEVNFGYVPPNETVEASLFLNNTSQNDAVLTLAGLSVDSDSEVFDFTFPSNPHANPGESIEVLITFTPEDFHDYTGQLTVVTNDTAQPLIAVNLRGTAFSEPGIRITPSIGEGIDFGAIRVGESEEWELHLYNAGGAPLTVTPTLSPLGETGNETFNLSVAAGDSMPAIAPLETAVLTVVATPEVGGDGEAVLQLATNDPNNSELVISLHVFGNAPVAEYSMQTVDLGDVVMGWQSDVAEVTVRNSGTGDLTIYSYDFEIGSSPQIVLGAAPALPVKLSPDDDAISFAFLLNGQTLGEATATFLLQTDAIDFDTARLDLVGQVVSCIEGCPVANGSPSCEAGYCAIGACAEGYHDTNVEFTDGCECQEELSGNDIGHNCSTKRDLGILGDKCSNHNHDVTVSGNLHGPEDVDLYFVKMSDESSFLTCDTTSDSFRARVELLNAPPGLKLCVNIQASGTGCGGYTQEGGIPIYDTAYCGQNSYTSNGSWSTDDDKDVVAWVVWEPGAEPVCSNYEIKFDARD